MTKSPGLPSTYPSFSHHSFPVPVPFPFPSLNPFPFPCFGSLHDLKITNLPPGIINGRSRCAGARNSIAAVRIALPPDGAIRVDNDILVGERDTLGQGDGGVPSRVAASVLARAQSDTGSGGPVAEGSDAADELDGLSVAGGDLLVEGDENLVVGGAAGLGGRGDGGAGGREVCGKGRGGGGGVGAGDGRGGAGVGERVGGSSAPRGRDTAGAAVGSGEEGGVGPGQVGGADGGTGVLVELLGERAVGRSVLGDDVDEAVGVGLDGVDDGGVGGRGAGVGAGADGGDEVLEEGKGGRGDRDGTLLLPDVDGIVELLGGGESGEVPGVAGVVNILGVATNGGGLTGGAAIVDTPEAHRVDNGLVVGKSTVAAGLEGFGIATGSGVKVVDGSQDGVDVLAAAVVDEVGDDIAVIVPEALLEAQDLGSNSVAGIARAADGLGKRRTLHESTVRGGNGEEGRAVDLLPKIETSVVPVLSSVGKIVLHNGPDDVLGGISITVADEPPAVADEGDDTKGRTISLGTAPFTGELLEVDHELGLTKTGTVGEGTGRVANALKLGLRSSISLDGALKSGVVFVGELVDDKLLDKGGVTSPGVPVY